MRSIPDEDPADPRIFVPNIEFYITNVCNLTCTDCNRFNNHDFRGWQDWADYASDYEIWAQHIRLQRITIMGGEPLLNPTVLDWVDGINDLWQRRVQILTNGTRLNHVPKLYDRLVRFREQDNFYRGNWIGVSIHNPRDRDRYFDEIKQFLQGDIQYHHQHDADNVDNCQTWGAAHAFVDSNGMRVHAWEYTSFYPAAVHMNDRGRLSLYDNDPETAHRGCGFAMFKCYHFIRAKIYKCGPVALFAEFDLQHALDLSDSDRLLVNSYHPLTVDSVADQGRDFFATIDQPIPQCKFCPVATTHGVNRDLFAVSKKKHSQGVFG